MTAPATLALPPGGRGRPVRTATVTALLAGVAELMVMGALLASYLNVRGLAARWPARGVHVDNYLGTMLLVTLGISVITAEWSVYALRHDNRRQSLSAQAITIGLGLAFVNLLWYVGTQLHFGPGDNSYAVLVYAMLIAAGVIGLVGLGFMLVAMLRTVGDQVTAGNPALLRAAAWHWHVVTGAWFVAFLAIYLLQHR